MRKPYMTILAPPFRQNPYLGEEELYNFGRGLPGIQFPYRYVGV